MKPLACLFLLCLNLWSFAQQAPYSKETIALDDAHKYLLLIRNEHQRLIYTGAFDTPQSLPVGSHYHFNDDGSIKNLMEYSFSGDFFEGVPVVTQTTHVFDENQKIEKIIQAQRCTECEYSPTGTWFFYKNGTLEKTVKAHEALNLAHREFEIYWELLERCK
ncbi:hypothetical protein [Maribacter sp. 2307ULW6-5]|uniref:hypothetical protein n=1 Tax=Maribacter sp. 2307ULW6-5 TaxID=3386275 RepID=UPI0039BCADED